MICPHCKEKGREATVWPYDDNHVTCKFGHIQRPSNTTEKTRLRSELRLPTARPIAYTALAVATVDLLLRLFT